MRKHCHLFLSIIMLLTCVNVTNAQVDQRGCIKGKAALKVKNPEIVSKYLKRMAASSNSAAPGESFNDFVPEGETRTYSLDGYFFNPFGLVFYKGFNAKTIFTDDNKVYIRQLFPFQFQDAWACSDVDGETITFKAFTKIWEQDWNGDGSDVSEMVLVSFIPDEDGYAEITDEDFKMIIEEDRIVPANPEQYIGVYDAKPGQEYLYDYTQIVTLDYAKNAIPVTLPEGAEPQEYFYEYNSSWGIEYKDLRHVYVDGDDYYFDNLDSLYPGSWIKGTKKDNVITVQAGQYLGDTTYVQFFQPCQIVGEDEYGNKMFTSADEFRLIIDGETLRSEDGYGVTEAYLDGSVSEYFTNDFKIYAYGGDVPAIPSDPYDMSLYKYESSGYDLLYFYADNTGSQGEYLRPDNLSYIVYFDDVAYTFKADTYKGLTEDLTQIPYTLNDGVDFTASDSMHYFYFYNLSWDKIGVQMVYTVDGVTNYSNIVSLDNEGNPIASVDNMLQNKTLERIEYYDLSGRKITADHKGFVIYKEIYSDGTMLNRKVIIR